jgi:hypothetical protein
MNETPLHCWRCGAVVIHEPLPLSRRAECRACRAELHVCRQCLHYDPRIARQCREDRAEDVTDKTTANFCDWFEPRPDAHQPHDDDKARTARAQLDALFGMDETAGTPATAERSSKAEQSRQALEDLFGLGEKKRGP